jgi:hypothetical protein
MLLKFYTRLQNHAPRQTVICQVKISRAAMKAAQEAAKAAKAPVKGKKNNIFFLISKSISCKLVLFLFNLSSALSDYFKLLLFRSTNTASPQICPAIHFNLLSQKRLKRIFITIRAIYNLFTL